MKIDTHQHFWKYSKEQYPWITEGMEVLAQDRLPSDLNPLLEEHGIEGTIAVQARQVIEETKSLLAMADEYDFIRGVVGWVDLRSPDVQAQLEKFKDKAKMVGVRHVVQDEPDDKFVLREDFMRGISRLKDYDLVYDILIFPHQLPATIELLKKFPEQVFILDHMAKPYIKDKKISQWQSNIEKLASFDNVSCKISGMVTEADWHNWSKKDFKPYMEVVFEAFGTKRLTIGSDWPVCTLAGDYGNVISIATDFITQLSNNEQKSIWQENPERIYGL
jgi:L-fuconolactonase